LFYYQGDLTYNVCYRAAEPLNLCKKTRQIKKRAAERRNLLKLKKKIPHNHIQQINFQPDIKTNSCLLPVAFMFIKKVHQPVMHVFINLNIVFFIELNSGINRFKIFLAAFAFFEMSFYLFAPGGIGFFPDIIADV